MNDRITVFAFTFNEQKRIVSFLESVKGFAPIVVVDNHSTDQTLTLAQPYVSRVITHRNAGYAEHPDTVRHVLREVTSDWIYWGRVDELPPAPLLQRLTEIVVRDEADAVYLPRLNLLFGNAVRTWGDDYQLILFKRSAMKVDESALFEHSSISPEARRLHLPPRPELSLWHFSAYDVAAYTNTNNRYSSIAVREILARPADNARYSTSTELPKRMVKKLLGKLQRARSMGLVRCLITPPLRFFWHYVWRGGFRSGRGGFATSYLMMMEQMLVELKLDEAQRGISLAAIELQYDELKRQLVAGQVPPVP